jgi:hypothetical protein
MQLVEALKGINCQMAGSGESLFTHCDEIAIFFWTILTLSWSEVSTAARNWTVERTIGTFGRHRNTGRVMMGKEFGSKGCRCATIKFPSWDSTWRRKVKSVGTHSF